MHRKPPTSPCYYMATTVCMRGAEDEHVCDIVQQHLSSDLAAAIAEIKKSEKNRKQSLATLNQASWSEAKMLRDFFLANKAAVQPTVRRSEQEQLQGLPPALTPYTIIALGSDMVPLRDCMDGKLFEMSVGTFDVWILIFSRLSEDDTQAFLAGDMTFYGATRKVVATEARAPSNSEKTLRQHKAFVTMLQGKLAEKNKRMKNYRKMMRKVKTEMEGKGSLYEGVVAALGDDDDA